MGLKKLIMETKHIFKVKHLPATLTKPSRTKIISERFRMAITVRNSDAKFDKCKDAVERAEVELKERGFDIEAIAEGINCMYILSNTFKTL
jgi:hypothetical protein